MKKFFLHILRNYHYVMPSHVLLNTIIYSFTLIGLVETHAVIAFYPLIVAGLSVPFLGEKMGWRRWGAIAIGFFGVVIILRPSLDMFSAGAIIALLGAILFAIYIILTRYVSKQ